MQCKREPWSRGRVLFSNPYFKADDCCHLWVNQCFPLPSLGLYRFAAADHLLCSGHLKHGWINFSIHPGVFVCVPHSSFSFPKNQCRGWRRQFQSPKYLVFMLRGEFSGSCGCSSKKAWHPKMLQAMGTCFVPGVERGRWAPSPPQSLCPFLSSLTQAAPIGSESREAKGDEPVLKLDL